jgi:hypothetical protein
MKANGPSSKGHENLWKADFFADFCKRHSVESQLDAEGNPSLQMLAQFGLLFLEASGEQRPGRPRETVERRTKEDLAAIRVAMEVARTSGRPFEKVITPTMRFMENKGFYPVPKHGGDRTTAPKRLARLKRTIDEEENLILARALADASNRRRKPGQ